MSTKSKSKKEKSKISKLIEKSDSENDENEHELSFYIDDRVKLMKEVLKIIKPKKIKSMAPDCIKDLDIEEINSMLLEELLGISNKRLKYIFNGQNLGEDSSSTDPEEEKQPIDVISLDDVSDDDFIIDVDSDKPKKKKHTKIKEESRAKKIKKEKHDKSSKANSKHTEHLQEENLMSVLELLELQARARAIRSQLMLEASKKSQPSETAEVKIDEGTDDEDAVIIEVPKNDEIVITSSDSENEQKKSKTTENVEHMTNTEQRDDGDANKKKKIKLIRDRFDKSKSNEGSPSDKSEPVMDTEHADIILEKNKENTQNTNDIDKNQTDKDKPCDDVTNEENKEEQKKPENKQDNQCNDDEDEIILIVDQEEMEGIIGD